MIREEILKVAKPILFNTENVRAILADRKMVTRRVMKPQPIFKNRFWEIGGAAWSEGIKTFHPVYGHSLYNKMPYKPGDYLYIRETWERFQCVNCEGDESGQCFNNPDSREGCYVYRATHYINGDARWHPSIHMPKEAARIFLRVTDIKVERIKDMTADSAMSEGFTDWNDVVRVWDSTIKPKNRDKYGWNANPYVWVIEFERVEVEE